MDTILSIPKKYQFSVLLILGLTVSASAQAASPLNVDGRTENITSPQAYTDLKIGIKATGIVNIEDAGKVDTNSTFLGHGAGSLGILNISGADASLSAKFYIKVGYLGDGELTIKDGATVKTVQTNFAEVRNTRGSMTVTGGGTTLDSKLSIGVYGHGEVNIEDGALVRSEHVTVGGTLSDQGTGKLVITGKNSHLQVTAASNILYGAIIGSSGEGEVIIEKGGMMSAYNISLGNFAGSRGEISLLGDSSGIGILKTKTIENVEGDATFNFDGGKLQAMANSTLFKGFSASNIQLLAGGGNIDSDGFTVTMGTPLTEASGNGSLTKSGQGTLSLSGENSYKGSTFVQEGKLTVTNNATFSANSIHTVGASGILDLNGSNQTVAGLVNKGLVSTNGGQKQSPFVTLTVGGDYSGSGMVQLNSELGDDNSRSDFLHIHGRLNDATKLAINQVAGAGALTTGDGIPVVQVDRTVAGSISLEHGRVAAGAYEYTLRKKEKSDGSVGWYLNSGYEEPEPKPDPGPDPKPDPGVDPDPGPNPKPDPKPEPTTLPNYRVEVPIAVAAPMLNSQISAELLSSYYERTGAQTRYLTNESSPIWARAFGVSGKTGKRTGSARDRLENFERYGSVYSYKIAGVQFGADLYTVYGEEQAKTNAGLYAGLAYGTSDVDRIYGGDAGKMKSTAYAVGGYWTQHAANGAWVDAVAQFTFQHFKGNSDQYGVSGSADAHGFDLSLEAGYPINLNNVVIEPQAQIVYQYMNLGTLHDPYGKAKYDDAKGFLGRIGARASTSWLSSSDHMYSAWTDVSLWRNFSQDATVHFTGLNNRTSKSFSTERKETWLKMSVGMNGQIDKKLSMFGTLNYRQTVGNRSGHAWGAMIGA